ncbi:hypothetical protein [Tissierella sp. Yu-01]|nr:hypothetical protein [Tissierella sp. Yu-01]WFA08467.1 hypothetical protein P3962_12150 [Tissierella sp. Yu-01]
MKYGKLFLSIILIMGIIIYSVADINHGHGLDEHGFRIINESRG